MNKIKKHHFEPVSLLTVENGILALAVIPAQNQPDWLVPKELILSIDAYDERIWTYLWHGQEVAVYHLIDKQEIPDKLVVLEGNSDVHRLALQTAGEIDYKSVRISDVKDAVLPEDVKAHMQEHLPRLMSDDVLDFMYQVVRIGDTLYIVPELDLISHRLVDLDS